jgi:hypothetical protein
MGLFGRFKKGSNSNIDLSIPSIKRMVDWIQDPAEFNKKPDAAAIFDERNLFWPTQKTEYCVLIKFSVDGQEYIGFTGPITWCFIGVDFNKMSTDNLYETYCGWHIAYVTLNSGEYNKANVGSNLETIMEKLRKDNYTDIRKLQNIFIGGQNYYEFGATRNGDKVIIVGVEDDLQEYKHDYILPFYEYIGIGWNPLDK